MTRDPPTTPADACAPDADRAGTDASARLPEWVIQLIALVVRCVLMRVVAGRTRRSLLPSWWYDRPDLPPGSAEALAASARGPFGNTIVWMCRCQGIGPGHPEWPELSRAIVAFGGSIKRFRAGLSAAEPRWWESPSIVPGMNTYPVPTPAADAVASLLSRQAEANAPQPAPGNAAVPNIERSAAEPLLPPVFLWQILARAATGPPTGPPAVWAAILLCMKQPGPEHGWPRRTD
jgi:hypothetical protein